MRKRNTTAIVLTAWLALYVGLWCVVKPASAQLSRRPGVRIESSGVKQGHKRTLDMGTGFSTDCAADASKCTLTIDSAYFTGENAGPIPNSASKLPTTGTWPMGGAIITGADIDSGSIDNTTLGATVRNSGLFTNLGALLGVSDLEALKVTGYSDDDNGICTDLDGTVASGSCSTSTSTRALCEAAGGGTSCAWNSTDLMVVETSETTCSGTVASGTHTDCTGTPTNCSDCSTRVGCNSIVGCSWDADVIIADGNGVVFSGISAIDFGGITEFLLEAGVSFNAGGADGVELPQPAGFTAASHPQGTVLLVRSTGNSCTYAAGGTKFNLCVIHNLAAGGNVAQVLGDGNTTTKDDYKCIHIDAPVAAGETFRTVWVAPDDGTIVDVFCETTGSNTPLSEVQLQKDNAGAQDMLASDCACDDNGTGGECSTFSGAENSFVAGDKLDLIQRATTGSVDSLSVCWRWRQ
jgi:hypothetical protein